MPVIAPGGNPATVADIEARWRPLTPAETTVAESLLGDSWVILMTRLPSLLDRITAGTLDPALVVLVESSMVLRVLRNPDGKRQESIDDYSWTRDNAVAAGLLYLSDTEAELLSPSGGSGQAFSIRPFSEPGYRMDSTLDWS